MFSHPVTHVHTLELHFQPNPSSDHEREDKERKGQPRPGLADMLMHISKSNCPQIMKGNALFLQLSHWIKGSCRNINERAAAAPCFRGNA